MAAAKGVMVMLGVAAAAAALAFYAAPKKEPAVEPGQLNPEDQFKIDSALGNAQAFLTHPDPFVGGSFTVEEVEAYMSTLEKFGFLVEAGQMRNRMAEILGAP